MKTKDVVRKKILTNGFTPKELFSLRKDYKNIRNTFNPKLIVDVTLLSNIYKQAKNALSPLQINLPVALFFLIPPVISGNVSYYFMPFFFILSGFWDVYSSARQNNIAVVCQLKLIRLGVRLIF